MSNVVPEANPEVNRRLLVAVRTGNRDRIRPDEQTLKSIVGILSGIVLEEKFDANHIDFDLRTKPSSLGLTLRFAESFYETQLPWQK
ncbi:hypothetical protein [Rhizobium sullae]|uniref:Uncharacterized protein n=1 Tax=Rhizobium sullae TaxID=50338 RepID=A0A4R3PRB4_RHISU|nr:hypothetical protein [Rhizobium sullae]TCU06275.1 hypothetical protein EV132_1328 [Rhizobium sullae]